MGWSLPSFGYIHIWKKDNFPFHQPCLLLAFWAWAPGPTFANRFWRNGRLSSQHLPPGVFPKGSCHHEDAARKASRSHCSWLSGPGGGLGISYQLPKPFVSGILPVSPLLGTGCQHALFLGGTERHLRMSWGAPRPSKSTGVHPANFSFELEVLFWHFCQLVLMYVWCWGLFVLESVYLGLISAILSEIYDSSSGVSVYSVCVIGILVFVKWKIQVQFIRKILAMKLWLKKKRFFKHWVATKCSLNSKNWLWWKSFIFAYVIRENFFFLFTILTLIETKKKYALEKAWS